MIARQKLRLIVPLAIFTLFLAMMPSRIYANNSVVETHSQTIQHLPNGLTESVKAVLGPMQFPGYQQTKLLARDRNSPVNFGYSVALSNDGNTAIVGAAFDSTGVQYNGAAYVFVRSGNTWGLQAKLLASDGAIYDQFGSSVALNSDGSTALIGAIYARENGWTKGAAYVFTRSGAIWTQQAKLLPVDAAIGNNFGWSVALSNTGDTAIIGTQNHDDDGMTHNGAAYIFTRTGGIWGQQTKLLASDKADYDLFGYAVALSGDGTIALVGAQQHDDGGMIDNGAAYVFTYAGGSWTQQTKLLASDRANTDIFGYSVALSNTGNAALIGALWVDASGTTDNGAAYVFTYSGSAWTEQAKLLASDKASNDLFGYAVALDSTANTAVISAYGESDSGTNLNGAAYVFTRSGNLWTQQAKLLANDKTDADRFGCSVALSGDGTMALAGAPYKGDSNSNGNGAAYIFSDTAPIPVSPDTVGVYKAGMWYLRNNNSSGAEDIFALFGGDASDLPVVGDWNGNGVDTIGVYRTSTGFFFLSDSNTAPAVNYTVLFGNPGDTPFAGKWTIDMTGSGIGVYRNSNGVLYQRKSLTSGFNDFFAIFGNPGDQPVAGDWDGDGFDSIGVYRNDGLRWHLTNNSMPNGVIFSDLSLMWDIGPGTPAVGDWNGSNISRIGYLTASGVFVLHAPNGGTGPDNVFAFGPTNSKPVVGKWVASSRPSLRYVIGNTQPGISGNNVDTGAAD